MSLADLGPLSILLVEDNPGDARLVEHYLRELSGGSLEMLSLTCLDRLDPEAVTGVFDVVLLDLGLPGSTGLDTLDRYLALEPKHPVVVLTGFNDARTAAEAISYGAQDYLPKDELDADRLGRTIRYAIERHQHERELQYQNARLDEFATVVSHDLRNPLNVALGHLELHDETCQSEHGRAIKQSLVRMQTIIDDALTLARQGNDISNLTTVDLSDVVEQAWACVETDSATLHLETPLPVVTADVSRLQQLFENLFRNCVEHGSTSSRPEADDPEHRSTDTVDAHPSGDTVETPTLTVSVGCLDGQRGFYVADDGAGIAPESHEQVFEAGYTTATTGTGFGLAIVRRVAEAHGWDVSLADVPRGTRFEFTTHGPRSPPVTDPASRA